MTLPGWSSCGGRTTASQSLTRCVPARRPAPCTSWDAAAAPLPTALAAGSTHGIGLGTAFELALSLDRLPARLMVYGIEGCRGADGAGLSPAVSAAADRVVAALVNESGAAARR